MRPHTALLALPLALTACARPPKALRGSFAPVIVADVQGSYPAGERVRCTASRA